MARYQCSIHAMALRPQEQPIARHTVVRTEHFRITRQELQVRGECLRDDGTNLGTVVRAVGAEIDVFGGSGQK